MDIARKANLKTVDGPEEFFTGRVTITGQFQRPEPSRVGGAIVHFEPGARTAWHTHPAGQTLIVTEGVGWTNLRADPSWSSTLATCCGALPNISTGMAPLRMRA
jgi:quercetin dioxygenase-like cupin family protein